MMHDRIKRRIYETPSQFDERIGSLMGRTMAVLRSTFRFFAVAALVLGSLSFKALAQDDNRDQFTYQLETSTLPNNQYSPEQWQRVECGNLEDCLGWPEKFLAAPDWTLRQNDCLWCPASGNRCGTHHNSPINLERNRAVKDSKDYNPCIDVHRMNFLDSSCTFDELIRLNAFSIERHALQIKQPIEMSNGAYRVACRKNGQSFWGRLDYSKGFSDLWYLSHTDIHLPSEHTQEGKRYDGELQFYQFYSVPASESKAPNQMGTVSIFLEAGYDDYDVLNKLICEWRRVEEETRGQCGLPSVSESYSGCPQYRRRLGKLETDSNKSNLRKESSKAQSVHTVLVEQLKQILSDTFAHQPVNMSVVDNTPAEDIDWDNKSVRDAYPYLEERKKSRHLADYDNVPWHNYFGLLDVNTEYYFRYSGTQTIPPCFGEFLKGTSNRANTNHWRVMKDPILISDRQLNELHRLLKNRIAPSDDPIRPCQADTAARPYDGNSNWVNVSRPLQATHNAHYKVFCECENWKSQSSQDQAWCQQDRMTRLYKQPYNFAHDGF